MAGEGVRILPPAVGPLVTLAVSLHLPVFNAELVRSVEIKVLTLYGEVGVGGNFYLPDASFEWSVLVWVVGSLYCHGLIDI